MGRTRPPRPHRGSALRKRQKTKRHSKDLDQIFADLPKSDQLKHQEYDDDKTGGGQYYCVACSRYFMDRDTLEKHNKTKPHKRRLKTLAKDTPYSQEEAERAAGMAPSTN